jgi:hypothetical protein
LRTQPHRRFAFHRLIDRLPSGVKADSFEFWKHPVFKTWRIELGAEPTAREVSGAPFSTQGFAGSVVGGKLYAGEGPDYSRTVVYEIDPASGHATEKFSMDGLFYGLRQLP